VQQEEQADDHEDAGRQPDRGALRELGELLGDLRLGQLDLLADEELGLVGDLVDCGDDARL
jgi:hypothetical protein